MPDDTDLMVYVVAVVAYVAVCKLVYNTMLSTPDEQLSDLIIAKTAVLALGAFIAARYAVDAYQAKKLPFASAPGAPSAPPPVLAAPRGPVGRQLTSLVPRPAGS